MKTKYAFLCTLLAMLILVSSAANVFLPSEHDCMNEGCQICQFISIMERLFETVLLLLLVAFLYAALVSIGYLLHHYEIAGDSHATPVALHVKLSN